jgi:hypothetical protein
MHVTNGEDGYWYATFEIDLPHQDPESTIRVMLEAIESLDDDAPRIWSDCKLREFDIGYSCGDEPWAYNHGLTNETLLRIAALGASLRITLYPPDKALDDLDDDEANPTDQAE